MKSESIYNKMTNAEKKVADFLKELGIEWIYERPVFIWDRNQRPRVWAPDFFLKSFNVYVEVCGSQDFNYEYRRKTFDRNGYRVIFLHVYKEKKKWENHLISYLRLFTISRIQKLHEVLNNDH